MKIALWSNSRLVVSAAWSLCQLEAAREIIFVSDPTSSQNRFARSKENVLGRLQDLVESNALNARDATISISDPSEGLADADLIILLLREQSGFRSPQVSKTTGIAFARRCVSEIQQHAPAAKILVAASHANYIAAWIHQTLGGGKIIGLGNGGPTAHLTAEIAKRVEVSVKDVTALTIGNDWKTYPLPQYCRVNGIPLAQLMPQTEIDNLCETVTQRCLYTIHTEYTLISYISQVVLAIVLDKKRVMSVGTHISAGSTSVYLNVPARIGRDCVASIVPLDLEARQREQFRQLVIQSAEDQTL